MKEYIKGIIMIVTAIIFSVLFYATIIAIPVIILAMAIKWVLN